MAGLHTLHQNSGWRQPPAGVLMMQAWSERLSIGHYLPNVEAVTQLDSSGKHRHAWPQFNREFLRAFCAEYPEAVIVLHTRDPRDTIRSMRRWGDFYDRVKASAPGLSSSASDAEVIDWIEDYYEETREFFSGDKRFVTFDIADPAAREKLELAIGRQVRWWGKANEYKPGAKG